MIYPVEMMWTGEVMRPQPRFLALAKKQYTVHETYMLGVREERSGASHRHYFACINEAWNNLPENKVKIYPSPEHLRRRALIVAGYYNERVIYCDSRKQAEAIVAFIEAIDEFSEIKIMLLEEFEKQKWGVRVRTAKSQSSEAMNRTEFEKSKADVLALLAQHIGVSTKDLNKAGEKSDV